jgi:hypothetical protein
MIPTTIGLIGLMGIGFVIYWHFNKAAKKRHLEELRRAYESMSPTDPQYNTARALFIAATISQTASESYSVSDGSSTGSSGSGSSGDGD